MQEPVIENLFALVRDSCTKETWSEAVSLVRGDNITTDKWTTQEIELRVLCRRTGISRKVMLWPEDEDWKCECREKEDPCRHVAAAVIALRSAQKSGLTPPRSKSVAGHIRYHFTTSGDKLLFERHLVDGENEELLTVPLSSLSTQRVASGVIGISPTSLDMEIEVALGSTRRGQLPREILAKVVVLLAGAPDIMLDGVPVRAEAQPTGLQAVIDDDGPSVKITGRRDPAITRVLGDALALCDNVLRPLRRTLLDQGQWEALQKGLVFGRRDFGALVAEMMPRLARELTVVNQSRQLPVGVATALHVELELVAEGMNLRATGFLAYGDPPLAIVRQGALVTLGSEVPLRDTAGEAMLKDRLWQELALVPETTMVLARDEALILLERARKASAFIRMSGEGRGAFQVHAPLQPLVQMDNDRLSVAFMVEGREDSLGASPRRAADAAAVFRAYAAGDSLVPLLGGGFAPLPHDFLARYGGRLMELLAVTDDKGRVPRPSWPALAALGDDMGVAVGADPAALRRELATFTGVSSEPLPADLTATLRSYQLSGSDWLRTLRRLGLGALLADDMGLG